MRSDEQRQPLDLSGVWQGVYSYPGRRDPVAFVATLDESQSWLTGATEETGDTGDARGVTISATLQGRRTGSAVTWLKLYDRASRVYDAVHYEGDVSADGREIHGRWTISGSWSGTFLMIRAGGDAVALMRETAERV
jgi:hypothetical protein